MTVLSHGALSYGRTARDAAASRIVTRAQIAAQPVTEGRIPVSFSIRWRR